MRIPLLLLALLLAGAAAAEGPSSASKVQVTIVGVRATPAADGVEPGVGPGLEKVAAKLKRLPFARFVEDSRTQRSLAPGETISVAFAGSGRFAVEATAVEGGVELHVREFAPSSDQPCLAQRARLESGRTHVTFCDGVPSRQETLVFLSTVTAP